MDKINIRLWNGYYYCTVKFPDSSSQELKSFDDLNYSSWQEKIAIAWNEIQNPPTPIEEVNLIDATTEEIALECVKRGLTAKDLGLSCEISIQEIK